MNKSSDNDFDLELHFLPAWAQKPSDENRYAQHPGEGREDRSGDRRERRPFRPGMRRQGGGGPSPQGGPGRPTGQGGQGRGRPQRGPGDRGGERRFGPERTPPPPAPLPELNVAYVPDEKGVDSLARQIKMTGRAYPLFEIAQIVLARPDRHTVTVSIKKNAENQVIQALFLCALDDSLWLSEEEAVQHVLNRHFTVFYQPERTKIDPPKGTYTFVAQCGLSGTVLGPPNYHDYQTRLRKLHSERFSRMPFEVYKARVKIVRDEAVVKNWLEEQSWRTEYVCLNLPDPLKLGSREEVEKHFRETHLANIIKQVDSHRLSGTAGRNLPCPEIRRLLRQVWEDQRRFPLQVATVLSQQFAARGLQFFKVNKTVTHVAVARPHYLDLEAVPVSEGIRQIVHFINAHPKCSRREILAALVPGAAQPPPASLPQAPTAPAASSGTAEQPPAPLPEPSPEQTAVIGDLHWLIHQGHVIEFANGTLDTAKKPIVRPPKPAPAPQAPEGEAVPPAPEASAETAASPPSSEPTPDQGASAEAEPVPAPAPQAPSPAVELEPSAAPELKSARSEVETSSAGHADSQESPQPAPAPPEQSPTTPTQGSPPPQSP